MYVNVRKDQDQRGNFTPARGPVVTLPLLIMGRQVGVGGWEALQPPDLGEQNCYKLGGCRKKHCRQMPAV